MSKSAVLWLTFLLVACGDQAVVSSAFSPEDAARVFEGVVPPPTTGITAVDDVVRLYNTEDLVKSGRFAYRLSDAGDVNGDGFDDVLVGAPSDGTLGLSSGAVLFFFGGPDGLQQDKYAKFFAPGGEAGDQFGGSVSGAGDLNNDGYDDAVVGAYLVGAAGTAYVFWGGPSGPTSEWVQVFSSSDGAPGDFYGRSVSGAGDVNADGFDDLIVGAHLDDDNGDRAGAAYVYLGSAGGLDLSSETKLLAPNGSAGDYLGATVSDAGDVDGDGFDDVLVAAEGDDDLGSGAGAVYVFNGSASGVLPGPQTKLVASDGAANNNYGADVERAGDVNGDGYSDVIVGMGTKDLGAGPTGAAYVYLGGPNGIVLASEVQVQSSENPQSEQISISVAGGSDFGGDGYDDIIIGLQSSNRPVWNAGSAYVFSGSAHGVDLSSETRLSPADGLQGDSFGIFLSDAGDVDGDGFADLIVGTPLAEGPTGYPGIVYAYSGACWLDWYADVDGDGYGDPNDRLYGCVAPEGYIADRRDCDDADALISPEQVEVCDSDATDEDCSGQADDSDPTVRHTSTWFADLDGDGFGDEAVSVQQCRPPQGYLPLAGDCDDSNDRVNPDGSEVCDAAGIDEDCDGAHADPCPKAEVDECGCATSGFDGGLWGCVLLGVLLHRRRDAGDVRARVAPA